jgi:hypothetical protein
LPISNDNEVTLPPTADSQTAVESSGPACRPAAAPVTVPALLTSELTSAMLEMFEIFTSWRRANGKSSLEQFIASNVRLELHETGCRHFSLAYREAHRQATEKCEQQIDRMVTENGDRQ